MTVGLLHTSPVHVATFDALLARVAPGRQAVHAVDERLLTDARARGPEAVRAEVAAAVRDLVDQGVDVVVCTCSTIGPVAESVGEPGSVPVLRVDRPAAVRAAELARTRGGAVGAVVAVESTVPPTRALLEQVTDRPVEMVLADGAWERFEVGDETGYLVRVEAAVRELAPRVAVVLLAQASMAGVVERVADLAVPVLATPPLAVEAAVRMTSR